MVQGPLSHILQPESGRVSSPTRIPLELAYPHPCHQDQLHCATGSDTQTALPAAAAAGKRWGQLSRSLKPALPWCLSTLCCMCHQQHTQSCILALRFHEVHFEDRIPTPVFSSKHKRLVALHVHLQSSKVLNTAPITLYLSKSSIWF